MVVAERKVRGHLPAKLRMGCSPEVDLALPIKGLTGDAINATLAAAGANLLKLLRRLFLAPIFKLPQLARWPFQLIDALTNHLCSIQFVHHPSHLPTP